MHGVYATHFPALHSVLEAQSELVVQAAPLVSGFLPFRRRKRPPLDRGPT